MERTQRWGRHAPGGPEYYRQMLCQTTQTLLARDEAAHGRIVAVTVTTQRLTMVNLDRGGEPLRPAIVRLDQRKANAHVVLSPSSVPRGAGRAATRSCR